MGSNQNLYEKAKKIIPGGTMLLSKRPEMFLPGSWPNYFESAKGVSVVDYEGKSYTDMAHMSVGTCSLGYGNAKVDESVVAAIRKGNMSTLNAPEEVLLGEKLLALNPWADMVRFARTGGEANAIAIRIARAATGRDKVLVCGYHGWHDWYLAANLESKSNLNKHLLTGLSASGVPKSLEGETIPFNYNDIGEISKIIEENHQDIAAVKMEVVRSFEPEVSYLESIRKLCSKYGIVLIFDECTSGFRETFGGVHAKYNVYPDLCMYGKALGNGYAITSVVGRKEIMKAAETTFISSTFWTERIGSVAALATLEEMQRLKSWERITHLGAILKNAWGKISEGNKLEIDITGLNALATFTIRSIHWPKYKTFITQEFLKNGFLASNVVYMSTCHDEKIIDDYSNVLDGIFNKLSKVERGDIPIEELRIEGDIAHSGFQRLN